VGDKESATSVRRSQLRVPSGPPFGAGAEPWPHHEPNPGLTRAPAQVVGALQATAEPRTSLSRSAPTVDLTRLNFTLWYPLQPGVGSPRLRLTWQHSDPRAVLLLAHTHLKLERTVFEAGAEFIQGFSREVGGGVVGVNRGRFQHTGAGTSSVLYCMRYRHSMPNPPHQMHHTVSNTLLVTQFAASLRTEKSPQSQKSLTIVSRSDIRLTQHLDSSAQGLVRRGS
jgi:hypothetical protein